MVVHELIEKKEKTFNLVSRCGLITLANIKGEISKKKKKKIVCSSFDQLFFCTISKNIFRISEKSWYSTQDSFFLFISTAKAAIAIPCPNKPSLETDFSSTL